ncbi:MAG: fibronectin type III domain-containing protein, partial [Anaerolineae bacterium]|nr:fibronectin type III domain-containing protein [Anaerolineae bacterium]
IVAPSQSFTRASGTYIRPDTYYRYFPIIFKRWPPIPYAPTLDNIDNTDENGDYTVSWSYNDDNPDVPDPTAYTLQEATDANFTNPTEYYHDGSGNTSHEFTDQDEGTYYYRVQGHNEYGAGEWSSVKSATVVSPDFFDNFSSSSSGWTTHQSHCCLSGCDSARQHLDYKYDLYYGGGWYHVNIPLDCRGGGNHGDTRHIYPVSFAPGVERSTSETCIELKGRFEEWDPYWSFWGLVFAASEDMSTVYSLEVNNLGDWGIVKRTDYQYPGPNHPFENETRTNIVPYIGEQRWPAKAGFTSNTLMVRVTNKKVKLYINGEEVYSFSEEILSLKRVGIIGGNWEITPTQIGYDYFLVDEGCDDY